MKHQLLLFFTSILLVACGHKEGDAFKSDNGEITLFSDSTTSNKVNNDTITWSVVDPWDSIIRINSKGDNQENDPYYRIKGDSLIPANKPLDVFNHPRYKAYYKSMLQEDLRKMRGKGKKIFRLFVLPTWGTVELFQVDFDSTSRIPIHDEYGIDTLGFLRSKKLSHSVSHGDGYNNAPIDYCFLTSVILDDSTSEHHFKVFEENLERFDIFNDDTFKYSRMGTDGTIYILEMLDGNRYHITLRHGTRISNKVNLKGHYPEDYNYQELRGIYLSLSFLKDLYRQPNYGRDIVTHYYKALQRNND